MGATWKLKKLHDYMKQEFHKNGENIENIMIKSDICTELINRTE